MEDRAKVSLRQTDNAEVALCNTEADKIHIKIHKEDSEHIGLSMQDFLNVALAAKADMDIWVALDVVEIIEAYIYADVTTLWVQYGADPSRFNIYSNQVWEID